MAEIQVGDRVRVTGEDTEGVCEPDDRCIFVAGMVGWTGKVIRKRSPLRNGYVTLVRIDDSSGTEAERSRLRGFSPELFVYFRPHNLELISALDLLAQV